jgi:hypothetical protein
MILASTERNVSVATLADFVGQKAVYQWQASASESGEKASRFRNKIENPLMAGA